MVFLPRNLAANIDASVENGGAGRIEADPALGLNVEANDGGPAHASVALNGGGAPLKLRSIGGKIRLQFVDEQMALRKSLLDEQKQRLAEKLSLLGFDEPTPSMSAAAPADGGRSRTLRRRYGRMAGIVGSTACKRLSWAEYAKNPTSFRSTWCNRRRRNAPPMARRAVIEGVVVLQVRAKTDGTLEVEKVLEGNLRWWMRRAPRCGNGAKRRKIFAAGKWK